MKQGDLVDNTATFAMIMSFSFTQWTRIAVLVILPNAYQLTLQFSPPILWNVKLCIRRIASGLCFSDVHLNVSVKHSMFFLNIYEIKDSPLVC